MSDAFGFVAAGAQIGIQNILIKPKRGIFNIYVTAPLALLSDIIAQATIEERHIDRIEVTDHPVEYGAQISDHAFRLPAEVTLVMAWSNSPNNADLLDSAIGAAATVNSAAQVAAGAIGAVNGAIELTHSVQSFLNGSSVNQIKSAYNALLALQSTRALFDIYTGKRSYKNMICRSISTESDCESENSLTVILQCQEILLVNTSIITLPRNSQLNASETASCVENGNKQLVSTGK